MSSTALNIQVNCSFRSEKHVSHALLLHLGSALKRAEAAANLIKAHVRVRAAQTPPPPALRRDGPRRTLPRRENGAKKDGREHDGDGDGNAKLEQAAAGCNLLGRE